MTTAQYQHQQVLLALATPGTPRRVSCRCGYTENDIQIGRAREAQLIAEAERFAAATNQEQLRRWAANRAGPGCTSKCSSSARESVGQEFPLQ